MVRSYVAPRDIQFIENTNNRTPRSTTYYHGGTSCHVSSSYVPIIGDFLFWFHSLILTPPPLEHFFLRKEKRGGAYCAKFGYTLKAEKKEGDLTIHTILGYDWLNGPPTFAVKKIRYLWPHKKNYHTSLS